MEYATMCYTGFANTLGWVHRERYTGVRDVCQRLVLDLRALRGDLVKEVEDGEGNSNGEGRS